MYKLGKNIEIDLTKCGIDDGCSSLCSHLCKINGNIKNLDCLTICKLLIDNNIRIPHHFIGNIKKYMDVVDVLAYQKELENINKDMENFKYMCEETL